MATSGDQEVYIKSLQGTEEENIMSSRDVIWIADSNSGSYNGQIVFDTSLFNSSNKWLNYSESYLEIPFAVSMAGNKDISAGVKAFYLGLKAGYHQIIDSISVQYGTKDVVQLQSYINFHTQFKLLTSMSQDDYVKFGSSIGFVKDSSGSYSYAAATAYKNNKEVEEEHKITTSAPESFNQGFLRRRIECTAYSANDGYNGITLNAGQCKKIGKNYLAPDGGTAEAKTYTWYVICQIRLKDLADFFSKIPLVKNGSMRITVNYNSSVTTLAVTAAGDSTISAYTQNSGHTNVVMIGEDKVSGTKPIEGGHQLTIACNILRNSVNNAANGGFSNTSCRLYCPSYRLSPKHELALITRNPITKVSYTDIYSYVFTVPGADSSFNQILSNGIVDAQYLLMCPFIRSNSLETTPIKIPTYQSIYDSAPGTTSPLNAHITELQVTLAGNNVLAQNQRYTYEAFSNELARINAIMGGTQTGITSGLLSKFDFENAYAYYVVDLSRRDSAENLVPKAVMVSGTNISDKDLEIICFIGYRRHLNIDTATGIEMD
jgi:hypothetical protein